MPKEAAEQIPAEERKFIEPETKEKNFYVLSDQISKGEDFEDLEKSLSLAEEQGFIRKAKKEEADAVDFELKAIEKKINDLSVEPKKNEERIKRLDISRNTLKGSLLSYKDKKYCRPRFVDPSKRKIKGPLELSAEEKKDDALDLSIFSKLRDLKERAGTYVRERDKKKRKKLRRGTDLPERVLIVLSPIMKRGVMPGWWR